MSIKRQCAKPANIVELITKGAMEMVITVNTLGHTTGEVNIEECASPLSAGLLTLPTKSRPVSLQQLLSGASQMASFQKKRSYFEKQTKKKMEENSSRTAPSSTDACNSIVHALMCRRQGGNWADIHIYFFSLFVLLESFFASFRGIGNIQ